MTSKEYEKESLMWSDVVFWNMS